MRRESLVVPMVGKSFNKWTVLAENSSREQDSSIHYQCRCDCGTIRVVSGQRLRSNSSKHCGCVKQRRKIIHDREFVAYMSLYSSIKALNKKYGISNGVSFERFKSTVTQNCFYCGDSPVEKMVKKIAVIKYHGIDRINSQNGYIDENILSCCLKCNIKKMDFSIPQFLEHLKRVFSHAVDF